jgi:hypothetical protein
MTVGSVMAAILLKKIQAIATVNNEIIVRIKSKEKVIFFKYEMGMKRESAFQITLKETKEEIDAKNISCTWKGPPLMIPIPDIFNDKININCTSFEDLERLNNEILQVSLKYRLFGESDDAKNEMVSAHLDSILILHTGKIPPKLRVNPNSTWTN